MYISYMQVFKNNIAVVHALKALAARKGCTVAQLCIAWVSHLGPHMVPIPGSTYVHSHHPVKLRYTLLIIPTTWNRSSLADFPVSLSRKAERTLENIASADIVLTAEDLREIQALLQTHPVQGVRSFKAFAGQSRDALHLWG